MRLILNEKTDSIEFDLNSCNIEDLSWYKSITLRSQTWEILSGVWWGVIRSPILIVGCKSKDSFHTYNDNKLSSPFLDNWVEKEFPLVEHYSIDVLKSALQKAVRRKGVETAKRVAWQLIRQDPIAFLRRWPVIVTEDCIPCIPMLRCLWMMITLTSVNRPLSKSDVNYLMKSVFVATNSEYYDMIPNYPIVNLYVIPDDAIHIIDGNNMLNENLFAMLLRSSYGGMRGDILFQRAFPTLWKDRFNKNFHAWNAFLEKEQLVWDKIDESLDKFNFEKIGPLIDNYKLAHAIDYHCAGSELLTRVLKKLNEETNVVKNTPAQLKWRYTVKGLTEMIWHCRSGVYSKHCIVFPNDLHVLHTHFRLTRDMNAMNEWLKYWKDVRPLLDQCREEYWKPLCLKKQDNTLLSYFSNKKRPRSENEE